MNADRWRAGGLCRNARAMTELMDDSARVVAALNVGDLHQNRGFDALRSEGDVYRLGGVECRSRAV